VARKKAEPIAGTPAKAEDQSSRRRLNVIFSGRVQGVGFRYSAQAVAGRLPVTGWVRNLSDGRVELLAEGETETLESLLQGIGDAMAGYIDTIERTWAPATGEFKSFEIRNTV
jgi:acylphosphatase